ncbi:unnamed protein product, partial [marine sediment metagenome]
MSTSKSWDAMVVWEENLQALVTAESLGSAIIGVPEEEFNVAKWEGKRPAAFIEWAGDTEEGAD